MEKSKVDLFIGQYGKLFPKDKTMLIRNQLERLPEEKEAYIHSLNYKKPVVAILLSVFLGGLGIDRFYVGDIGLGIVKFLFTLIVVGTIWWIVFLFPLIVVGFIWWIVDLFKIPKKAKEVNFQTFSMNAM